MNEENTVISSREEHCLQVLPTQVNVRIYAIHTSGPVLAEASANLNGCFTIRGLKVVDVGNGPFISMPERSIFSYPLHPEPAPHPERDCGARHP